jgi:hypothetical protein
MAVAEQVSWPLRGGSLKAHDGGPSFRGPELVKAPSQARPPVADAGPELPFSPPNSKGADGAVYTVRRPSHPSRDPACQSRNAQAELFLFLGSSRPSLTTKSQANPLFIGWCSSSSVALVLSRAPDRREMRTAKPNKHSHLFNGHLLRTPLLGSRSGMLKSAKDRWSHVGST